MKFIIPFSLLSLLAACFTDESSSGYAAPDATYVLKEINGATFNAQATISFPASGEIAGQAPCNTWFADQPAPYPWFEIGPIGSTRMACPEMAQELVFFEALTTMSLIEFSGPMLILSNDVGHEMVFDTR